MAEKKKKKAPEKAPAKEKAKAPDMKKILVVAAVIAVVVIISIMVDNSVKNPRSEDWNEASNQVLSQGIVANNPAIEYETSIAMYETEPVTIDGKEYFPIPVIANEGTPEEKTYGPYYVAIKDSKIFIMDETTGKLVPYGV